MITALVQLDDYLARLTAKEKRSLQILEGLPQGRLFPPQKSQFILHSWTRSNGWNLLEGDSTWK